MQISPLKLTLIVIGSALAGVVLMIAATTVFVGYRMTQPGGFSPDDLRPQHYVSSAPDPMDEKRFLGATGHYSTDPSAARNSVLDAGPGRLVAVVTSNGKPVKGLRLRLLLNGSVMSQWATTDADGRYAIEVPYGKYRVDGYELDSETAHSTLAGKTTKRSVHSSAITVADKDKPGQALSLEFVDPVRMTAPFGEVDPPVVITWQAYPGAAKYRLRMAELKDPQTFRGVRHLFQYGSTVVTGTSFDAAANGLELQKGYYYSVDLDALDAEGATISEAVGHLGRPQFRVAEK